MTFEPNAKIWRNRARESYQITARNHQWYLAEKSSSYLPRIHQCFSCIGLFFIIGRLWNLGSMELGEFEIRANAISPGAVDGQRIHQVLEGRASATDKKIEEVEREAMSVQSIKRLVDPEDKADPATIIASDF